MAAGSHVENKNFNIPVIETCNTSFYGFFGAENSFMTLFT